MKRVSLFLGDIGFDNISINMSRVKWLHDDGQYCKKGTPIAYCNIQLKFCDFFSSSSGEMNDLQVIFIMPVNGTLIIPRVTTDKSLSNQLTHSPLWGTSTILCDALIEDEQSLNEFITAEFIIAAGKRYASFAENRSGILSGWFERSRAWVGDKGHIKNTILTLGICDILDALKGTQVAYLDFIQLMPTPSQIILFPDGVLIPTAAMVLDQLERSTKNINEITVNFSTMIKNNPQIFSAEDYIFLGSVLKTLTQNDFLEGTTTITNQGINQITYPSVILTSLTAQPKRIFRHKILGYSIAFHDYRLIPLSSAVKLWLIENFEPVIRGPKDISLELTRLANLLGSRSRLLVCNMSTSPYDSPIAHYDLFDSDALSQINIINRREMNVMLDTLADEGVLEVVDVNRIVTHIGSILSFPDATHMSSALEIEFLKEVVRVISLAGARGDISVKQ